MLVKLITDLAPSFLGDRPDHRQVRKWEKNHALSIEGVKQHNPTFAEIGKCRFHIELIIKFGRGVPTQYMESYHWPSIS
jgi:hypothetical protein